MILFESWFDIHHSYAVVARNQVRAFGRAVDDHLRFAQRPYCYARWKPTLSAEDDIVATVSRLRWTTEDIRSVYRVSYPYDPAPPARAPNARVFLFLTAEYQLLTPAYFPPGAFNAFLTGCATGQVVPIVPSSWCGKALASLGISRFHVVPHGVNPEVFCPWPLCAPRPRATNAPPGAFVFLTLGSMTRNKGIFALLRAFAVVRRQEPHAFLMLKGSGSLYGSFSLLKSEIVRACAYEGVAEAIEGGLAYSEADLAEEELRALYATADCYVAPYEAEGFCMPALEALACGVPVIASAGGPTDEFLPHHLCASIAAPTTPVARDGQHSLAVDVAALADAMIRVMRDPEYARRAREVASSYVRERYSWKRAADATMMILRE